MADASRTLPHMLAAVIQAREDESARVSRVLHDEVGQVLSAAGLQLTVLRLDLQAQVPEIGARTAEIQALLERAVTRVRELSYELHAAVVERAGLHFALDRLAGRYRDQFAGVLRLQLDPSVHPPTRAANAMYRIAERALDNALRHADARQITLSLRRCGGALCLEVVDDGVGFHPPEPAPDPVPKGLGLLLMHSDAARAGLDLTIASAPGCGTSVRALHDDGPSAAARPGGD